MSFIVSIILTLFYAGVCYYLALPAINLHNPLFWIYVISIFFVFALIRFLQLLFQHKKRDKFTNGSMLVTLGLSGIFLILLLASSPLFRASTYANRIKSW